MLWLLSCCKRTLLYLLTILGSLYWRWQASVQTGWSACQWHTKVARILSQITWWLLGTPLPNSRYPLLQCGRNWEGTKMSSLMNNQHHHCCTSSYGNINAIIAKSNTAMIALCNINIACSWLTPLLYLMTKANITPMLMCTELLYLLLANPAG